MLWNYQDDVGLGADSPVQVTIRGVPATVRHVLVEEYRIDDHHSNAFEVWKEMGSPQVPSAEQLAKLKAAGQLELMGSPRWVVVENGQIEQEMEMPRESVSLLRVSWN
jgi:xylan 1,4-beta-xylosidase